MTLPDFQKSLAEDQPPAGISPLLLALWYDASGKWETAHELAQEINSEDGSWVHAYLHRKEGDQSNASYWYRQAGKNLSEKSLQSEWEEITSALLRQSH